jgi:hypothetical protein
MISLGWYFGEYLPLNNSILRGFSSMKKHKIIILALILLFSIISISMIVKNYSSKPIKMIYYLKDGETRQEVATRFGVKVEDMKLQDRYLSFEVK